MQWQPIETAPKDGRRVILAREGATASFCGFYRKAAAGWCDETCGARDPTHWMPLPAPPSEA